MALVITAGDLLNVRLNYANVTGPDVAFNVLHYRVGSMTGAVPALGTALAGIGSAMYTKWSPLWSASASASVNMSGVSVTNVFPLPRSVTTTFVPGTATAGAVTGDSLPLQDSPTLLKRTDVGMRWGYGRLFFVGVPESRQMEGVMNAPMITALGTMAAALSDNVSLSIGGWSVTLNPVLLGGPEDNPVHITPITSGRLSDPIIKSMKTRRPGKGI